MFQNNFNYDQVTTHIDPNKNAPKDPFGFVNDLLKKQLVYFNINRYYLVFYTLLIKFSY